VCENEPALVACLSAALRSLHARDAALFGLRRSDAADGGGHDCGAYELIVSGAGMGLPPVDGAVVVVSYELRQQLPGGEHTLVGANDALEVHLGRQEVVTVVETCAKQLCVGQTAKCLTTLEDLRGAWGAHFEVFGLDLTW
jgi:hypothetical protein